MTPTNDSIGLEQLATSAEAILSMVAGSLPGQRGAAETLLAAYVAGGHVLLEGVPGIGKTLLARTFAACLGLRFSRVQFTPDLMPADVIGINVFDSSSGSFRLVRGPLFTQILMADEINRTPPKTQSALLEAMQEMQVTIDGVSHPLSTPFFVVATQNPIEFEGTYPLPEAQRDRFLARIEMGLPDRASERELFSRASRGTLVGWGTFTSLPGPVVKQVDAVGLRSASARVHVADELLDYLANLADAVRRSPHVDLPVSPRGCLALLEMARSTAFVARRDYVTPDDFKRCLVAVWAHRILLTAESEIEGHTARRILEEAAASTEVPH